MKIEVEIAVAPQDVSNEELVRRRASDSAGVAAERVRGLTVVRRALDARRGTPRFRLRVALWVDEEPVPHRVEAPGWRDVSGRPPVIIVGAGPAGLFAALHALELGLKPVILERGKAVRDRRFDLARLVKEGAVDPDSNYCFGEGGAGTFSDGKLYTRSTKRGSVRRILERLVLHGADPGILVDSHPHIGTNKLPKVVQAIRQTIVSCGGEVRFGSRVTDLVRSSDGRVCGVTCEDRSVEGVAVLLATGHSARDVFTLCVRQGIAVEPKPFAVGVRVEHPQSVIDRAQYRLRGERPVTLPAASYDLVVQSEGRGVYSFCMCPGGIICPAATAPGEVVTNGWSPSTRSSYFANSGIVVEVVAEDLEPFSAAGPLRGVGFQRSIEQEAFRAGGGRLVAPAQRIRDFIDGRVSPSLPRCSYLPGISSVALDCVLPPEIAARIRSALAAFGDRIRGFLDEDGIAVGVETRTSSPVRIPRDPNTLQHPQAPGLFPCGEGAGYAGGIVSAAIDGERCMAAASLAFGPGLLASSG